MKNRLLIFALIAALLAFGSAQAQASEFPLILWIRGDLYRVDAEGAPLSMITSNGTISGPALSPDGARIAYKTADQVGLDALNRVQSEGVIADFDLPGDISILDIASGESTPIAGQPADASLLVEGTPDRATVRSTPIWSPDGARLAWTEFALPDGKPGVVVYDVAAGTTTTVAADIPAPLVQGAAPPLRWGSAGFAVNASTDNASEQDFLIYAEDGTLLSSPRLAPVENDPAVDFMWVESAGGAKLGVIYQSSGWILIDPASGVAQAAPELPRLTTAQPDSRALRFGVDSERGFFWEIVGETTAAPGAPSQVTLSPSGREVAFTGYPSSGAVTIWRDGETTPIPGTGSNLDQLQVGALLWGYTFWQIG